MARKKPVRQKGKLRLSKVFQELKEGDCVALVRDLSQKQNFHKRLQGRTGTIEGKRGKAYIVKIGEKHKEKIFIINPIHLKKLSQNK